MAKKNYTYRDILADIRKGQYAPVYLLMGEEPYYIDLIMGELEKRVVAEADRDFNSFVYYGADCTVDQVAASAQQLPMMAPKVFVALKEAQTLHLAKASLEKLRGYVERPNSQAVLAISYKAEALGATHELVKAVEKNGLVFRSPRLRDYMVASPLRQYVADKGYRIDDKALDTLVEFAGAELTKLFGEVDKLVIANPGGDKRITVDMVTDLIGVSKNFNNLELLEAINSRNYAKAMQIVEYFSRNPNQNPVQVTTALVFNHFARVAGAVLMADKSDASLMKGLQLRSDYQLKAVKLGLRSYPGGASIRAVHAIREFDAKSKGVGSLQQPHELLKELIFRLFTLPA